MVRPILQKITGLWNGVNVGSGNGQQEPDDAATLGFQPETNWKNLTKRNLHQEMDSWIWTGVQRTYGRTCNGER
jgi:hypothetical protein